MSEVGGKGKKKVSSAKEMENLTRIRKSFRRGLLFERALPIDLSPVLLPCVVCASLVTTGNHPCSSCTVLYPDPGTLHVPARHSGSPCGPAPP